MPQNPAAKLSAEASIRSLMREIGSVNVTAAVYQDALRLGAKHGKRVCEILERVVKDRYDPRDRIRTWSRNPYFKRIETPRSTTLHSVARALRDSGTHKVAVFQKGSILQKVSPKLDKCSRGNTPSSPSLYVLGCIKSDVSDLV